MGAPGVVAAYVIPSNDGLTIVDCGPGSTLPNLQRGLQRLGYTLGDVRHLLLTHIHLDHAGGAGALARLSGATVYVHRHGATHLRRPERLIESATRIYGAMMDTLWGSFEPVPENQLHSLEGTETLRLGGLEIRAVYTPGHAIHHVTYAVEGHVFCGDAGGVRLQGSTHTVAPTPPPDIDLETWRETVAKLRALEPRMLYPTHYGAHTDIATHFQKLEQSIDALETLSLDVLRAGGGRDEIALALEARAKTELRDADLETKYALSTPYHMAADGLIRYWTKRRPDALQ